MAIAAENGLPELENELPQNLYGLGMFWSSVVTKRIIADVANVEFLLTVLLVMLCQVKPLYFI